MTEKKQSGNTMKLISCLIICIIQMMLFIDIDEHWLCIFECDIYVTCYMCFELYDYMRCNDISNDIDIRHILLYSYIIHIIFLCYFDQNL